MLKQFSFDSSGGDEAGDDDTMWGYTSSIFGAPDITNTWSTVDTALRE